MPLKNVILELSLKPFYDESEAVMRAVARKLFRQWGNLTDLSDRISVLLWTSDGSEILEYSGDLSKRFEWAYWTGVANPGPAPEHPSEREKRNSHLYPAKYREDASPRSYAWLKRMIEILRETGKEMTGKSLRIGAAFDNGPEFAVSEFKYRRHPEICQADTIYKGSTVVCTAELHADACSYAAFPDGIPEGTSLGTFLGAQFKHFSADLGFDYIWLSNGMGFGRETWGLTGALFDKKQWYPERAGEAADAMLRFWHDLTTACPGIDIETRGSNYSAGTEIATDAAPLAELYRDHVIAAPVNSPWAALNYLSGLEIAAWMSHIAELPDDRIPFRFYAHDPWFMNSPWLDRYGRQPWDIYQVLACARLTETGEVQSASTIAILSADSTAGEMPDEVPLEVIPHLRCAAVSEAPDRPGILLWVYPFREYTEMVRGKDPHPEKVFAEEQFIGQAIQSGLPLNTVISTDHFRKLMSTHPERTCGSIKIVPVSAWDAVKDHLADCGDLLFYGSLAGAPEELLKLLQAENAYPLTGKCLCRLTAGEDEISRGTPGETAFIHPQFLAGGITEKIADGTDVRRFSVLAQGKEERDTAWVRTLPDGRKVGFVRSQLSLAENVTQNLSLDLEAPDKVFPAEKLPRRILSAFGWTIRGVAREAGDELPRINLSRHGNAFFYSVFSRNTTASCRMGSPFGAPVPNEMECVVSRDLSLWTPQKFSRYEVRCFVKQQEESTVSCKIGTAEIPPCRGRMNYSGLRNAELRFFPPEGSDGFFEVYQSDHLIPWWEAVAMEPVSFDRETTPFGECVLLRNVTGSVCFVW